MNQRVFIAMAVACKPSILIADEPTTSLDVTIEAQILKLLLELKEKFGFSMLFITHNLAIARKIAQRIYVMYRGKLSNMALRKRYFVQPAAFPYKGIDLGLSKIGRL